MPESKIQRSGSFTESESEDDESEEVIDIVWDFCRQSDLGDTLESFVTKHLDQLENLKPLEEEQEHRHVELFEELLRLCEEQIEDYIKDKKTKNAANKVLNFFAITIPVITIIVILNLNT